MEPNFIVLDCVNDLEAYVKYLIKKRINLNIRDLSKKTLLMAAVTRRSTKVVELLVNAGASVDLANEFLETPLFSAARLGHEAIVDILIKGKANIDMADNNENTPLKIALDYGYTSVAKILIDAGANPNKINNSGISPLYSAVKKNYVEIIKTLIQTGAKVNILDKDGNTPLNVAVCCEYFELVKLLLKAGAFVNLVNIKARTPIFYAVEKEYIKIVEILVEAGANVNIFDVQRNTPLYLAFVNGNLELMEILIEAGADVNAIFQNKKALRNAFKAANYECCKCLIRHYLLLNIEIVKPEIIQETVELSKYWNDCKEEIQSMLQRMFVRSNTSRSTLPLIKFLKEKNKNKLAYYYENFNFDMENVLRNSQYSENFSIYADMLSVKVKIAQTRLHLLQQCFKIMHNHWIRCLPFFVFYKIVDFLTCTDLVNLSRSGRFLKRKLS